MAEEWAPSPGVRPIQDSTGLYLTKMDKNGLFQTIPDYPEPCQTIQYHLRLYYTLLEFTLLY